MVLEVSFSNQIYASQYNPHNQVQITHLDPKNTKNIWIPSASYAYSVLEPYQMHFNHKVNV